MRRLLRTVPLAALALALAQGASAQEMVSYPEVDRMHDAAMTYYTPSDAGDAAWRHGRVALLRPADDERRFECMLQQAQLLYAAGFPEASRQHMVEAARQARATGNTLGAAMTYVDAAILAQQSGDDRAALYLADEARALVPFLGSDKAIILNRLGI